jgi:hypothetical protein
MDPISNADGLVLLLRQKLRERARRAHTAPGKKTESSSLQPSALQQLAAVEDIDERTLRRALVQNLLVEHFGHGVLNDAQFQQIVSRVDRAIEEDADAVMLVSQILKELRTS